MHASIPKIVWLASLSLGLFGCDGVNERGQADVGATVAGAEAPDLETLIAAADVTRGETAYFQCRACHTLHEGGASKVGPNLWGMFGRAAGTVPGFAYSDAVKNAGISWAPDTVDAWLEQPAGLIPGNNMIFFGIRDPQDRADLIAYLQANTSASAP